MKGKAIKIFGSFKLTGLILGISNIPTAFYTIGLAKSAKANLSTFIWVLFFITLINCAGAVYIEGAKLEMHDSNGLFGFLTPRNAFLSVFVLGFLSTIVNTMGYLIGMKYVESVIAI